MSLPQGTEMREGANPSWFNPGEAVQAMLYCCQLAKRLYNPISPADIGIIAPYRKQVRRQFSNFCFQFRKPIWAMSTSCPAKCKEHTQVKFLSRFLCILMFTELFSVSNILKNDFGQTLEVTVSKFLHLRGSGFDGHSALVWTEGQNCKIVFKAVRVDMVPWFEGY